MRLEQTKLGKLHSTFRGINSDNHHSPPCSISIENTSQSLPPGTTYNLDISLPKIDFKLANVVIHGRRHMTPGGLSWYEYADVMATSILLEARGQSVRDAGWKKVYSATYSKQNGNITLSHKIFDDNTNINYRYIALQDAQIIGNLLRLIFKNFHGGSATLWVKGQVILQ